MNYTGVYKAKCIALTDGAYYLQVPQVFGDTRVLLHGHTSPVAVGDMGFVSFVGGDAGYPVWVGSIGGHTADVGGIPDDNLPDELVEYLKHLQDRIDELESAADTHTTWGGYYEEGDTTTRPKNQIVEDDGWLMVSIRETDERPAPQEHGAPSSSIVPDDPFTPLTDSGFVETGNRWTFSDAGWVTKAHCYISDVSGDTKYDLILTDTTDTPKLIEHLQLPSSYVTNLTPGWHTIDGSPLLVTANRSLELTLLAEKVSAGASTTRPYVWGGESADMPITGYANLRKQRDRLRINFTDDASTDNEAFLLGLVIGQTVIKVEETGDASTFETFSLTAVRSQTGDAIEWDVTQVDEGARLSKNGGEDVTVTFYDTVATVTDYHQETNRWNTIPDWATSVQGVFHSTPSGTETPDNHAYGTDITYQPAEVPEDWEFMAWTDL